MERENKIIYPSFKDVEDKVAIVKRVMSEISMMLKYLERSNINRGKTKKPEILLNVTDELKTFLGLPTPVCSRANVLRSISRYVRAQNLQLQSNKRKFVLDDMLSRLLKVDVGENITFLAINKHISHLFVK